MGWALVGRALMGPTWALSQALMATLDQALMGWALMGWTLIGPAWALAGLALRGPALMGPKRNFVSRGILRHRKRQRSAYIQSGTGHIYICI